MYPCHSVVDYKQELIGLPDGTVLRTACQQGDTRELGLILVKEPGGKW